jgi:hypothetical protein
MISILRSASGRWRGMAAVVFAMLAAFTIAWSQMDPETTEGSRSMAEDVGPESRRTRLGATPSAPALTRATRPLAPAPASSVAPVAPALTSVDFQKRFPELADVLRNEPSGEKHGQAIGTEYTDTLFPARQA